MIKIKLFLEEKDKMDLLIRLVGGIILFSKDKNMMNIID